MNRLEYMIMASHVLWISQKKQSHVYLFRSGEKYATPQVKPS